MRLLCTHTDDADRRYFSSGEEYVVVGHQPGAFVVRDNGGREKRVSVHTLTSSLGFAPSSGLDAQEPLYATFQPVYSEAMAPTP